LAYKTISLMSEEKKDSHIEPTLDVQLAEIETQKKELIIQEELYLQKAIDSKNPTEIVKAMNVVSIKQNAGKDERKSTFIDPFQFDESFGYKSSPNKLTYSTLFSMSKTPVINAVIKTRKTQVAGFGQPQKDRYSTGFIIRKKGHFIEDDKDLTKEEKQRIEELTEFILNCGSEHSWDRPDFDSFLRMFTEDSLIYDQSTFEIVRDMSGGINEFIITDGSTMRIADSFSDTDYKGDERVSVGGYYPSYVQMMGNRVHAEYYPWELCFGTRNRTSRIHSNGYGRSELEDMVSLTTSMLWSDQYNRNFFRQGAAPKGILRIKGGTNNARVQEFRQQWKAMVAGVDNCISGDVIIRTKEKGTISVEDYLDGADEKKAIIWVGDSWEEGLVYKTSEHKKICQTKLSNGESITTSPDHKFKIIDEKGELNWKKQQDLVYGDTILLNKKVIDGDFIPKWNGKLIGKDLMEVLGWQIGDGYMLDNGKHKHIQLNYHHEKELDILDRHLQILKSYGLNAEYKIKERTEEQISYAKEKYGFNNVSKEIHFIQIYNNDFVRWTKGLGFNDSINGKVIPNIMTTMPKEYIYSFLRGYFSADGSNHKGRTPILHVMDTKLRNQTRDLLNAIGIRCNKGEGKSVGKFNTKKGKPCCLSIKDKEIFFDTIGFLQNHKQPIGVKIKNEIGKKNKISQYFILKHLYAIRENIKTGSVKDCILSQKERNQINSILCGKDGCSLNRLIRISDKAKYKLPKWCLDYHFEQVESIIRTNILIPMYDVSINEKRHQFIGNNILISNSWRTPVIDSESMEWIDLQRGHKDMEYSKWQEYLIKLACAMYTIDPSEIGFVSQNSVSGGGAMFETGNSQKIKYSKDKGLKPLLKFIAAQINKYIVSQIYPDLVFEFVGLDAESEQDYLDKIQKEVSNFKTINEVRKDAGLKPIEGGDIVSNSAFMQGKQQEAQDKMMQQQEEGAAGGGGDEGDGGEGQVDMSAFGVGGGEEGGEEAEKALEITPFAKDFNDMIDKLEKGEI